MALYFGDRTAEYEGRLTLNPFKHIDLFGSIILPLFLWISHSGFMIGWAKPVPYNPYNLEKQKIAEPLVAFAGPCANIVIAIIFGILIRVMAAGGVINPLTIIFAFIVLVNIGLAIFNLIPIPPLDGSKIVFSLFPQAGRFIFSGTAQKYGLIIIIALIAFLPDIISPLVYKIFSLITGLA